jgi:hypothetical protein
MLSHEGNAIVGKYVTGYLPARRGGTPWCARLILRQPDWQYEKGSRVNHLGVEDNRQE